MGEVGSHSRRGEKSGAIQEGQEGSGGPSREPEVVGRVGRGWEALPESWEWSRGPPGELGGSEGQGVVGRPSWRVGSGQEAIPEGREGLGVPKESKEEGEALQNIQEGL